MMTILDKAEGRIPSVYKTAQEFRAQSIDAMRDEIGRAHYTQAKDQLPKLERTIKETYRPFLDRIAHIQTQANTPLPAETLKWLREMATLCETVPNTIRNGLDEWDRLTPPIWTDGKSIDVTARAQLVSNIRSCLRNWDGAASRLDALKAYVERYIQESGWPATNASNGG